ncbi:20304_t:CDS:2, partial [Dentiscutata erythropus]
SKNPNSSTITRAKALVPAKRKAKKALLQEQSNKKYKIIDSLNKEVMVKDFSGLQHTEPKPNLSILLTNTTKDTKKHDHVETPSKSPEPPVNPYVHVLTNELRKPIYLFNILSKKQIKSKNNNALIINISRIHYKVIAAKQHFKKGTHSHLEIIFANQNLLKEYANNGMMILGKTYYGYIPMDARKSFLPVKIRNVPLGDKNQISNLIQEAFEDIGNISSIKPLLNYLDFRIIIKEPTITEVQEELLKENIPVSNLEENPKENAKNSANLDIMMMHTEER